MPQTTAFNSARSKLTIVDGYPLYTEQYGDRPDVVIVMHGGPVGDSRYLQSLSALSDEYRVVLYDQRGTGISALLSSASDRACEARAERALDVHRATQSLHRIGQGIFSPIMLACIACW